MNLQLLNQQKRYIANQISQKTILVSGASGLIGSAIVRLLNEINSEYNTRIRIIVLYRDWKKLHKAINMENENIIAISWDSEKENLCCDEKADFVIHCAGVSGGSKMKTQEPVRLFDINVNTTRALLDYCVQHHSAFLFASTYEVYGNISQETIFKENAPSFLDTFVVRNIYAECKRICEALCCAYAVQYGIKTSAVRLTSTFGRGVTYNDPRFFAEFARCILEGRNIVLKSTGASLRSYLDVDDAALAMLYVSVNGGRCEAYNLTNMENTFSIKEIANLMIEASKADITLQYDIPENIEQLGYRKDGCTLMDASKIESLGWHPVYTFNETILKLMESMRLQTSI